MCLPHALVSQAKQLLTSLQAGLTKGMQLDGHTYNALKAKQQAKHLSVIPSLSHTSGKRVHTPACIHEDYQIKARISFVISESILKILPYPTESVPDTCTTSPVVSAY